MIILILFVHFLADFVLQPRIIADKKGSDFKYLFLHILFYMAFLAVFGIKYAIINGILHLVCDFFTSKLTKYFYKKQDWYNFFNVIGLDQFIHSTCLIFTLGYL